MDGNSTELQESVNVPEMTAEHYGECQACLLQLGGRPLLLAFESLGKEPPQAWLVYRLWRDMFPGEPISLFIEHLEAEHARL